MGALKSMGSQRLTSAIATPTNGTSDSARKKAILAAALSASASFAAAASLFASISLSAVSIPDRIP